ncbi:N-acetylmuramoyl-L-alanine amidase [Streptomyces sp. NPDC005393]|uniref:N-acetylmuramoyl-L-alanine amidase n=1 Tax=Streptomyces sp. NPDC005393 TaxID=3157041 RepID=UPI0033A005B4
MRAFLASSIGVVCTAALALPLALNPAPAHARAEPAGLQGGIQSLPLLPLDGDRGAVAPGRDRGAAAQSVRPFSLVGVVWDHPSADLRAQVQVRTRATGSGVWSPWRDLQPYGEEAPDPDSPERQGVRAHGGTAPLWVGDSDGVQARVHPGVPDPVSGPPGDVSGPSGTATGASGAASGLPSGAASGIAGLPSGTASGLPSGTASGLPSGISGLPSGTASGLPSGLRLELVDPGEAAAPASAVRALPPHPVPTPTPTPSPGSARPSAKPAGEPSPDRSPHPSHYPSPDPSPDPSADPLPDSSARTPSEPQAGAPMVSVAAHTAPRPRIITRAGWGANEKLREKGHVYSKTVKVAFIHHTVTGNKYNCSQVPSVLRSIYRYHVQSMGWRDYGYNFTIDKCGNIYEGRSGGVTKAVRGAHTLGFNTNSMGVAVLGTYSTKKPSAKAVKAVAKLTAWKLGLYKRNPRGSTHLVSGGGNRYKKGANVKLHVISGHRDGFATACPGKRLYGKLKSIRSTAARLQGR